jgi:1,2-diacylglycerol 3-beta-glucosyltransferase
VALAALVVATTAKLRTLKRAETDRLVQIVIVIALAITIYVYTLAFMSSRVRVADDSAAEDLFFVLLVPALNEEQVIGRTLASLRALRGNYLVLVIDDASDDATVASITPHLSDPRVRLMEQPPERARLGKGHVLNTGYAAVRDLGLFEHYGRENVVMVVFDSDARVEADFLEKVGSYFSDPAIAGVQSAVRMYNADQNLLTLWQHLEFVVWGTLFCRAKNRLGSATLGGNGQCVRFSALESLGGEPWEPTSLTEDLDLSLRLLMKGWQLRFCSSAAVWQEAVPKLRALVRQRSRWLQGHLVCWKYLPALLHSRRPVYTRLDLWMFLFLPLVFLPIGVGSLLSWAGFLLHWHWDVAALLTWYVLGFGMVPLVMVAWRKVDSPSLGRLLLHSHLFVFYSFVWFVATLVVYRHVLLGRTAWAKTSRVGTGATSKAESVPFGLSPSPAVSSAQEPLAEHRGNTRAASAFVSNGARFIHPLDIRMWRRLSVLFAISVLFSGGALLISHLFMEGSRDAFTAPEIGAVSARGETRSVGASGHVPPSVSTYEEAPECGGSHSECVVRQRAQVSPEARYVGGRIGADASGHVHNIFFFMDSAMRPCEYVRREGIVNEFTDYVVIVAGKGSFSGEVGCVPNA